MVDWNRFRWLDVAANRRIRNLFGTRIAGLLMMMLWPSLLVGLGGFVGAIGFLGAYTTFSTFEFETHALCEDGSWLTATTHMFASLFVGLLAVRAGIAVAKTWLA
jgi:fluoride exporter